MFNGKNFRWEHSVVFNGISAPAPAVPGSWKINQTFFVQKNKTEGEERDFAPDVEDKRKKNKRKAGSGRIEVTGGAEAKAKPPTTIIIIIIIISPRGAVTHANAADT